MSPTESSQSPEDGADRRIPVTILTGFLGAGKTTLLNHLLGQPGMARTAVLINEFGEVAVDHLLVEKVDESLVVLDSGCICCSVQGDLVKALKRLFMRSLRREIVPIERVLIETTGLADPAPVIHTLMQEPFISERYRCDGVITAVDATHAAGQLAQHREAVRQVAMADRLLITKCDLVDVAARSALAMQLATLNPGAARIDVFRGEVVPDAVSGCGLYDPAGKLPDVAAWLGEEAVRAKSVANAWRKAGAARTMPSGAARHAGDVSSFVLCFEQPLDWLGFSDGLGLLLQAYGVRILRIKGLLNVEGDPQPRLVQCVQHVAYPPASLHDWPDTPPCNDRKSRLVFIVRGLDAAEVVATLGGFCGQIPRLSGAPVPD